MSDSNSNDNVNATKGSAVQTGTPVSLHLSPCEDNTNTVVRQRDTTESVTLSANILRSVQDVSFPSTSNQTNHISGGAVVVSTEEDEKLVDAIRPTNVSDEADNERSCWICFSTDEDKLVWVQPCKCRGTIKWVHEICLYRWVDEKQNGSALRAVRCQQCKTEYIIVFPQMGKVANMLEALDNTIRRVSPALAVGLFVGSLYWNAVTYGAITFLQVVGHKKGLALMKLCDPILLFIGLPVIPVSLVLGRMIRWEDAVIRLIRIRRSVARMLPFMNLDIPFPEGYEEQFAQNPITSAPLDPVSATRIVCGALWLPTISSIVGSLLFPSIESTIRRTLLGGLSFITVKGISKIYLKHQQYTHNKKRRIVDYTEENIRSYVNRISSNRNEGGNPSLAGNASSAQPQQANVPRPSERDVPE